MQLAPYAGPRYEATMAGRHIPLHGACNFRDLGGFRTAKGGRTRAGAVFRADALHRLTAEDLTTLADLNIATVFDLRSTAELDEDGLGGFSGRRARHVHLPLVAASLSPYDPRIDWRQLDLNNRYLDMLDEGGWAIRSICEAVASDEAGAVVFHCTGGKDRTGVVAAVLLRSLGVHDDDIVDDYARSQENLAALLEGYRDELAASGLDAEAVAYLTSSPPARMRFMLSEIDRRWGSVEGYLDSIGVGATTRERLGRRLVVTP